jgi:hypothetical protein
MRTILATTITVAMMAVASVAATPASAGSPNFSLTIGGFGPGYGYGYGPGWGGGFGGPIYVAPQQNNWNAHVNWCFNHKGPSYNPNTNKYFKNGNWKFCNSPFY